MLIALHRGTGLIARAIQWQTRSVYSHASLVFSTSVENYTGIEAREFKGVRFVPLPEIADAAHDIDLFRVHVTGEQLDAIYSFAAAQVGKDYDYTMVARFLSRRQESRRSTGKWFCSELVYAAFQKAGINLLGRTQPWEVSPGLLAKSPLLIHETTLFASPRFDGRPEPFDGLPSDGIQHRA